MNGEQLLKAIDTAGGIVEERELCEVVDASHRGRLVIALNDLERDGLVECATSITWRLTEAGEASIDPTSEREAV